MRVKCVDNWFYEHLLGRNKIYEVIRETNDSYVIMVDRVGYVSVSKDKFIIYKEDKMENRIVRKLEDLDGLENGMGATAVYDEVNKRVRIRTKEEYLGIGIAHSDEYSDLDGFLTVMKVIGFKFKYKPLRTVEEVLEEIDNIKGLKYDNEKSNWCIVFSEDSGFYSCGADYKISRLGTKYMSEEQAQKYADELNEIIGVGK